MMENTENLTSLNIPIVFVMVGISASGKSTRAKQLAEEYNAIIHSSDALREELFNDVGDQTHNQDVFGELNKRIRKDLLDNKNVIVDATNISIKSRKQILSYIEKINCHKVAYVMTKTMDQCLEDNIYRQTPVPNQVILRQRSNYQIPFKQEGFDKIIIDKNVDGERFPVHNFRDKMRNFDQKTKWHKYDLYKHCELLYKYLFQKLSTYDDVSEDYLLYSYLTYGALLHDYGKLLTQTEDEEGQCHYFQHENIGTYELLCSLDYEELYMSDNDFLEMLFYVNFHMLVFSWKSEKTHLKYKKLFGEEKYNNLIVFNICDQMASGTSTLYF